MNLFNKKILNQRIANYSFPKGEKAENILKLIIGWQKALKDSDLSKTKEKSIQGKFLNVFFEQILGYEDKTGGEEEWSLIAEPKTEVDAQTADGSIGFFTKGDKKTVGVIELKDAKTSLDKKQKGREKGYSPVEQGYLYATKFDRCKWIIISNFREIRLYNKARSEQFFERFDVLDLHKEDEFKKFYFLFYKENLISKEGDSPIDDLAKKSIDEEEDISKKFYSDYKDVRATLFDHLLKQNKEVEKKTLFEKSQKILDRIVFILFCEDTANLLPKNILKDTYDLGKRSRERSDEKVWREMRNLFIDIDEGRDDINPKINGYNGGLFKFDEILDNLHVKDEIWEKVINLSDYDFETDLNVNILGHIFEQSISDIENLKAKMEGEERDESKSKRKKDGIFYTPEYITKYIVENTVGKYLEEHPDKLDSIKILDPACGSGAFLNQAHSYLINEYKARHEQKLLEKERKGEALTLFDYNPAEANRAILLNNLYGVDLNDESVEITKLSLWLKTARKDEPLQNLDNNIKIGNSLIDDPEVAGTKAFDWKNEYKDILKNGGFDIIVGNPPYVSFQHIDNKFKRFFQNQYETSKGKYDLYVLFIEQSIRLLRDHGYFSMILPNKFLKSNYGEYLKKILLKYQIVSIIDFNDLPVFEDATTYPLIITIKKDTPVEPFLYSEIKDLDLLLTTSQNIKVNQIELNSKEWKFEDEKINDVLAKIKGNNKSVKDYSKMVTQGIRTGALKIYYGMENNIVEEELIEKVYTGKNVKAYYSDLSSQDRMLIPYKNGNKVDLEKYPKAKEYFLQNKDSLLNRKNSGKLFRQIKKDYFEYWDYNADISQANKIVFPDISRHNNFFVDKEGLHYLNTCYAILLKDTNLADPLCVILNSKMAEFFIHSISPTIRGGYYRYKTGYVERIPIPKLNNKIIQKLKEYYKQRSSLEETINYSFQSAVDLLSSEYQNEIFKDIKQFNSFGWNEVIDILEKRKIKLSLIQKEELQKWFKNKQKELQELQNKIDKLDQTINHEVYMLYGLTPEEVNIVEGSL